MADKQTTADVADKALSLADKWDQRLVEMTEKMAELVQSYGPQAVDLVLAAARISAISELVWALVPIAVSVGFWVGTAWCVRMKAKQPHDDWEVGAIFLGAGGTVAAAVATAWLLNVWAWAGVFYPELWLAKKIIGF